MNDMSPVIVPKSDQISADDLIAGPMTVTIKAVKINPGTEQPVNIFVEESDRAYRPCKSMSRVLVGAWGADASKYVGKSMTLYRDPKVKWGGVEVGGIRISHMSHIDGEKLMMLTATKGSRKPHKVLPLKTKQSAQSAQTEDAAANWANALIAKLDTFEDLPSLEAFEAEKSARLADLKAKRPELHRSIYDRLVARKAELAPSASPPADASTSGTLREILDKIEAATDLADVDAIDRDTEFDRQFLTEQDCDDLDAALAQRRSELRESTDA